MKKVTYKKNGFAFLGLIVGVSVIALVFAYSYYSNNTQESSSNEEKLGGETIIDTYKGAQDDIDAINKKTEEKNSELDEAISSGNEMIKVFNIKNNDTVSSPLKIEGEGNAFENTLIVELRNSEHEVMVKEFVTTKAIEVGESGPFEITLHFEFNNTKEGFVAVYEESAKDGSEQNLVEIPVKFD